MHNSSFWNEKSHLRDTSAPTERLYYTYYPIMMWLMVNWSIWTLKSQTLPYYTYPPARIPPDSVATALQRPSFRIPNLSFFVQNTSFWFQNHHFSFRFTPCSSSCKNINRINDSSMSHQWVINEALMRHQWVINESSMRHQWGINEALITP